MGKTYLIEHCIYAYNRKQERRAYEIYVTDRLKAINDSTAKLLGGSIATKRYIEFIESIHAEPEEEETRTAEQVISDIFGKLERLTS